MDRMVTWKHRIFFTYMDQKIILQLLKSVSSYLSLLNRIDSSSFFSVISLDIHPRDIPSQLLIGNDSTIGSICITSLSKSSADMDAPSTIGETGGLTFVICNTININIANHGLVLSGT